MNESGLYVAQMDQAKRAELEAKISRMVAKNSDDPVGILIIMLQREKDLLARVLICQTMVDIAPNDSHAQSHLALALTAAKKATQSNKQSSPQSSPLSSSPDSNSSASSSSSFAVSPMLPPRLSPAEKQRREFIQEARQQLPQVMARMRAEMQAETQKLAKEMQESQASKKGFADAIQDINNALKAAKIPEAVESRMLGKPPYQKLKMDTKIKYLKGKKLLVELLATREGAKKLIADCDGKLAQATERKDGLAHRQALLDRVRLEQEDCDEFYERARSIIEQHAPHLSTQRYHAEINDLYIWFIQQQMSAISNAEIAVCTQKLEARRNGFSSNQQSVNNSNGLARLISHDWMRVDQEQLRKAEIAENERAMEAVVDNFFANELPAHKKALQQELDGKIEASNARMQVLEAKKAALEGDIRLAEKGLREIGITPPAYQPQYSARQPAVRK